MISHGSFASSFFVDLARLIDRRRFDLTFASLGHLEARWRAALEHHDVEIVDLGGDSRCGYWLSAWRIVRYLRKSSVHIVHTHLFDPSIVGLTAAKLSGHKALINSRHHADLHMQLGKPFHTRLDRYCSHLATRTVVNSEWTRRVLIELERLDPGKIEVIPFGVDISRGESLDVDRREALVGELGLEGRFVLTVAGRLDPLKGHQSLLRALPSIAAGSKRPVDVLIAGAGPMDGALRQLADELGVRAHVHFLGFRTDLQDLFAISHLAVLPSLSEAFGQVVIEAMAEGVPVIATRVGALPELIVDGETGVLVEAGSVDGLAAAVRGLLADQTLRATMGQAARERVERLFEAGKMVRRYEDLYEREGLRDQRL